MEMAAVPLVEDGITSERREIKLLLAETEAAALAATLGRLASPVESRIVAVYFDSASAQLGARAERTPGDCVKVRAKAYAPDRSGLPGRVVLEVKRERAGLTSKERLWVAAADVRAALSADLASPFGALAPVLATSYRRRVYQTSPAWRVTLDEALAFHDADWSLFEPNAPPWHRALGRPFGREPRVVAELKYGAEGLPEWLAALGRARGTPYSKFAAALRMGRHERRAGAREGT